MRMRSQGNSSSTMESEDRTRTQSNLDGTLNLLLPPWSDGDAMFSNRTVQAGKPCSRRAANSGKGEVHLRHAAAVTIQRWFRGYRGRKEYLGLLYEQIEQEEADFMWRQKQQLNEGEVLIESYQLERELEEDYCIHSNQTRRQAAEATTIQRAWRRHKDSVTGDGNEHTSSSSPGVMGTCLPPVARDGRHRSSQDGDPFIATQDILDGEDVSSSGCHYRRRRLSTEPAMDGSPENGWCDEFHDNAMGCHGDYPHSHNDRYFDLHTPFSAMGIARDHSFGEIEYEDEFGGQTPTSAPFALPTTDWNSIEAVLRTESGIDSPEEEDTRFSVATNNSRRSIQQPHLQMVFVDEDSLGSDAESEPDVKVYVYEEGWDHNDNSRRQINASPTATAGAATDADFGAESEMDWATRELDSRDSGCVPGDLIDLNIEHVTDVVRANTKGGRPTEPAVESKKMLDSLLLHEEQERKAEMEQTHRKRKSLVQDNVKTWSKRELELLREELERKLREASDVLVEELSCRDVLHAKQDALLIDVEDWKKAGQQDPGRGRPLATNSKR